MAKLRAVNQFDQWAENLPDQFLLCRDMGHQWQPFTAKWDAKERGYRQVLRCVRCATERHRVISDSGETYGNHYQYPENYTAPHGAVGRVGAQGRAHLRLVSVLRLVDAQPGTARRGGKAAS